MKVSKDMRDKLVVFCWEDGGNPKGLDKLATLKGNSMNPSSYACAVEFIQIDKANYKTVIVEPSQIVVQNMIEQAKNIYSQNGVDKHNVKGIFTSCGFNIIFQQQLSKASPIPIFSSALLQIPFILNAIGDKSIAIITANKQSLSDKHLEIAGVNVENKHRIKVYGLENASEWKKIHLHSQEGLDLDLIKKDVVGISMKACKENENIGAILLECTDLPPFAQDIYDETGVIVFDYMSMVNSIY